MPRFRVIVIGTGMHIPPDGCIGFATTRFVRSDSEKEAAEKALVIVAEAVAKEPLFAGSPRPELAVNTIVRVRSPFKLSKPNEGYTFIGSDASLEEALSIERQAGAGWFR